MKAESMNEEIQTARKRLQLIEVLLVVLLLAAGIGGYFYFSHTYLWIGVLVFGLALLLRNKIEDWFLDLRDRI